MMIDDREARRARRGEHRIAWALAALLVAYLLALAVRVRADDGLHLARVAMGELVLGHDPVAGEVAAFDAVISGRRARFGGSYRSHAYGYSIAYQRQPWLRRLGRGPLPGTLGQRLSGGVFVRLDERAVRHWWPIILGWADESRAGNLEHGCSPGQLWHWGGPRIAADRRALEAHLRTGRVVRADCPAPFQNAFLALAP